MKEKGVIDFWIRYTWQKMSKMYNQESEKYGATMVHSFTLLSLDPQQGVASTTLGPKMGIASTSLSRTLTNLEKSGVIYREKNPVDGRGVLIYLTEKGKKLRTQARERVYRFNEVIQNEIGEEKLEMAFGVLENICQIIDNESVFEKTIETNEKNN